MPWQPNTALGIEGVSDPSVKGDRNTPLVYVALKAAFHETISSPLYQEFFLPTLTSDRALELIGAALTNTWRSGLLSEEPKATRDTVILGERSALDSLAFVTFLTDLEDLVSHDLGRPAELSVLDLPSVDNGLGGLTVGQLETYLISL